MKLQFTLLAILISSSLSCCSSNPSPDPTPPDPDKMPLTIQGGIAPYTKASDAGFDNGDAVGIYVVDYSNPTTPGVLQASGNHATNNKHVYNTSDNSWKPGAGQQIYWNDETTKVDIYGCYPFPCRRIKVHPPIMRPAILCGPRKPGSHRKRHRYRSISGIK